MIAFFIEKKVTKIFPRIILDFSFIRTIIPKCNALNLTYFPSVTSKPDVMSDVLFNLLSFLESLFNLNIES